MSEQGVGDLFEDPLPAAVEVENPGAGSPSWAIRKVSDEVSPAATRSDTTTKGVRGFLRAVVDDCSATLTRGESGGRPWRLGLPPRFALLGGVILRCASSGL